MCLFQSTLPCGERQDSDGYTYTGFSISIHAPLRGATKLAELSRAGKQFQSTLPCGERRFQSAIIVECTDFNPRSPAGSDDSAEQTLISGLISIHAPLRGATWLSYRPYGEKEISIHAPLRGATLTGIQALMDDIISIHAPLRGAT